MKSNRSRVLLAAVVSVALASCSALPDVSAFAESTTELRRASARGFRLVRDELVIMSELCTATAGHPNFADETGAKQRLTTAAAQYRKLATQLGEAAKYRAVAMAAFVDYSGALANIVASGKKGRESVESFAESLEGLVQTFDQTAVFPSEIVNIASSLGSYVIAVLARQELEDAVREGHPAVEELAHALSEDMKALEATLETKPEAVRALLEMPYEGGLEARRKLVKKRDELAVQLAERVAAAGAVDEALETQLLRVEGFLKRENEWFDELQAAITGAQQRLRAERDFVAATRSAIGVWADAHADLARALDQGRPPNVRALVGAVVELKELIDEAQKR